MKDEYSTLPTDWKEQLCEQEKVQDNFNPGWRDIDRLSGILEVELRPLVRDGKAKSWSEAAWLLLNDMCEEDGDEGKLSFSLHGAIASVAVRMGRDGDHSFPHGYAPEAVPPLPSYGELEEEDERVEPDAANVEKIKKAFSSLDETHVETLKAILGSFQNGDVCYDLADVQEGYGAYQDILAALKGL